MSTFLGPPLRQLKEAFGAFGLDPVETTLDELREAWRAKRSETHPDRGGALEDFNRYKNAYDIAHAWLTRPQPCQTCNGSGVVTVFTGGFNPSRTDCPDCTGDRT